MGTLITIEANDGAGKETQSKRLLKRLRDEGYDAMLVSFPNYQSDASYPVRMYLAGEFGQSADDVSPYAASTLFAVDRFASYKTSWEDFYHKGGIVIADRYTTANMVHQTTKFDNVTDKEEFLQWLTHFEYQIMGIPKPDISFFLDVPASHSLKVIEKRLNKIDGSEKKDIHESDTSHITRAYQAAVFVGQKYGWHSITCMQDDAFRSIEDIHTDIYRIVYEHLNK